MITRANGLVSGVVSVILGITAHGLAGGFEPQTSHLLIIAAIAGAVGAVRSAQVAREQRRRARGRVAVSWLPTAVVLVSGQVAVHIALSLLGSHAGHHRESSSLVMLGWHAAALPAAVAALCAISAVLRVLASTVERLRRLVPPAVSAEPALAPVALDVAARHLSPRLSVGMRAPPAVV